MGDDVPYLAPGEEPPGRWAPNPRFGGSLTWEGRPNWRTRHGPATVNWLLGRPHTVDAALTPEGRLTVEPSSPMDKETWRRRSASRPGGWVHGTLAIGDGDATFTDAPDLPRPAPPPRDPDAPPDLALDLAADGPFLARLQDLGFANAVYDGMRNADFRKGAHPRRWSCTWRTAGALVADMRSIGETYIDFYLAPWVLADGREPTPAECDALAAEVLAHYARLGWHRLDGDELAADHAAAMADIAAAERRPEGPCPEWAARYGGRGGRDGFDRAATAAFTGRLSLDEHRSITERLEIGMGEGLAGTAGPDGAADPAADRTH